MGFFQMRMHTTCPLHHQTVVRSSVSKYNRAILDEIGPTNQHADRLYAISAIGKKEKWRACYSKKGWSNEGDRPVRGIAEVNSLRSPNEKIVGTQILHVCRMLTWAALDLQAINVSLPC